MTHTKKRIFRCEDIISRGIKDCQEKNLPAGSVYRETKKLPGDMHRAVLNDKDIYQSVNITLQ